MQIEVKGRNCPVTDEARERIVPLRPEEELPVVGHDTIGEDAHRRALVVVGERGPKRAKSSASARSVARPLARFRTSSTRPPGVAGSGPAHAGRLAGRRSGD